MLDSVRRQEDTEGVRGYVHMERVRDGDGEVLCRGEARSAGTVVDLFCGAGGLSHGFFLEGFDIARGYDIDESCRFPFEANNRALFVKRDVAHLEPKELADAFLAGQPRVLAGCAPCQPFTSYARGRGNPHWHLLESFARLAAQSKADIVTMENVTQLVGYKGGTGFKAFVNALEETGYNVRWMKAHCAEFGVPQSRTRLVLIGSRIGEPILPKATHSQNEYVSVEEAIGDLPRLQAGQIDSYDALHRASGMSDTNLERIQSSKPGGTWRDWPPDLIANCHRTEVGSRYEAVYGRMEWNRPAPTITTNFHGFGNGRFGHPEQNRALSLREGAILQSFPRDYKFLEPGMQASISRHGRMIGNAVPVALARAVARAIRQHLEDHVL